MDSELLDRLVRRDEMAELIGYLCEDGRDLLLVTLSMNGMDAKEIASILGVTPSHVRWLRRRLAKEVAGRAAWLADERRRRRGAQPSRRAKR